MKLLNALKQLIIKYKHGLILSYFFIYIIWFGYLERHVKTFTTIHSKLDSLIPFEEIFIIPYLMWFFFIFITVTYLLLTSKADFYRCCAFLFIGMTICLIIYTVFPNGQDLRVDLNSLGRHNIFIDMVAAIYKVDTPANVFPSIHVFNSIGALIAIRKNERLHKMKWLQVSAFILTVLIILSTMFLKQHSTMDVLGAFALSIIMYMIVYIPAWRKVPKEAKQELTEIS
ncbi:MAG TPA: phosphatase PAP2 family protein [Mobilitalea sp.]|nr:phosphatase PAP2 family protein [Mobilitalea sp.]